MIQRLRDMNSPSGSAEADLSDAISAMPPIVAGAARQERIRAAVLARLPRSRRSAAFFLRPAIAGAILLAAGAAAAGVAARHAWVARRAHEPTGAAISPVPPIAAVSRSPASAPAAALLSPPVAPPTPAAHVTTRQRVARGEDPTALVEAVRALRSDHDPRHAQTLLRAYVRRYPSGALAEEALALQIEAAAALRSPQVVGFAREYLRLYPKGRFRQAARQALEANGE